ncbi:MAG: penicillin-binding protein 2 [Candidatus Doudnabacteria bacterium]|nr:penicillin-binding protein 2 [bacterium]MDZ4243520.1 penicillin-binding protein 2 [Candidatus Doudnabacteria bacterium]
MRNPFKIKNGIEGEGFEIDTPYDSLAFEESLFGADSSSQERLERGEGIAKLRLSFLWWLAILAFISIGARLYYLGITEHSYYREISEGNRLRVEYLPAPRGAVYDRYGEVLAGNRPSFELVATPLDLPKDQLEQENVIARVAAIIGAPADEVKKILTQDQSVSFQSVLIKQNISREQALIFNEQARELPGFRVVNTPIRDYKSPLALSHVLGFVGKISAEEYEQYSPQGYLFNDSLGKTGLEQVYEDYLRGVFGQRQVEVDARGIIKKVFGEKSSLPGLNLHLNIDYGLQQTIYDSLQGRLRALGRKRAAAIAMDPRNGQILAYVSLPAYDNNLFAEGISPTDYGRLVSDLNQPLFNRAISGTYPPGSTVKPMVAAAALSEGIITDKTVIQDDGYIVIKNIYGGPDSFFYGYGRRALGLMDVRRAIALSSDIFFYIMGGGYEPEKIEGLGIERLAEYYRKFKIHEKLGIDLPGEKEGLVPTPAWKKERFGDDPNLSRWYLGDTYHAAIGQGDLLASPLHVLSWTATIGNGGTTYEPQIVNRIEDNNGGIVARLEPKALSTLDIDPKYIQIAREGMRQAVTEGTARSLNSLSITSGAKTGTAQFDAKNPLRSHAWFAAFAPYENPEIAVVVLIEDGGEGGINSVPVVKDALDWWSKNR